MSEGLCVALLVSGHPQAFTGKTQMTTAATAVRPGSLTCLLPKVLREMP